MDAKTPARACGARSLSGRWSSGENWYDGFEEIVVQIQALSVVIPTTQCVNACPFCVSGMRETKYANQIEKNERFADLYEEDYLERMLFARDNGCNTVILTGEGEPLQNKPFLKRFANWVKLMGERRFRWIELQTSGFRIDDESLRWLRNHVRVSTIALSVVDPWDSGYNARVMNMPDKYRVDVEHVAREIKRYDFNLRLAINLTNLYDSRTPEEAFARARDLGANQVIFRVLYRSDAEYIDINRWIDENRASEETVERYAAYVREEGRPLERLPFGAARYSVGGISTVLDDNCMPQEMTTSCRYLILRPDCKLYSRWDDPGSLVF